MEYMMVNGYQIPALTLNEPPMPEIGKYGSLRRKFLRLHGCRDWHRQAGGSARRRQGQGGRDPL